MGRKSNKRIRVNTDSLPEDWQIVKASAPRVEIMPSKVHGSGKTRRAERRAARQRDRFSARDMRIERDFI